MPTDVIVPRMGAEVTDVTVVEWVAKEGQPVSADETVVIVETEKITNEIAAPASGFLHILAEAGTELPMGAKLAVIAATEEELAALTGSSAGRESAVSTPAVEWAQASGADTASRFGANAVMPAAAQSTEWASPLKRVERCIPIRGMRQVIAERMTRSLRESAQMTDWGELDATALVEFRKRASDARGRLSYPALYVKLVGQILSEQPIMNASLRGDEIVIWKDINVGVAVSLDEGLVVPVIHGVTGKSIREIQATLDELIADSRASRLAPDRTRGGTFTLTNIGSYGSSWSTPVINPPEAAILATGRIAEKPVAHDGQVRVRHMMGYSLTVDHRIIDGATAGRFLTRLRKLVGDPAYLESLA